MRSDDQLRDGLRDIMARSGLSMRGLSASFGRDPGYVAALLDPSRPSRAGPTLTDLLRASDATKIPFVALLEALWGNEPTRLADEVRELGIGAGFGERFAKLTKAEQSSVADYVDFLAARRHRRGRRPTRT